MSILSSLKSLVFPDAGMICPRCEKALEGHDEAACERRMSRRYFFGVTAGAVAAIAGAKSLISVGHLIATTDPVKVSVRMIRSADGATRLDVLYGFGAIHPRFAVVALEQLYVDE